MARINRELAGIAEQAVAEARAVVRSARRSLARSGQKVSGRVTAAIADLDTLADRLERIAVQTRQRVAGITPPGATRLVSLHDPDARPIAKGRLGKPVEFGYKAQMVDDDGIVVDHNVEIGNPPDAPFLVPAIKTVTRRAGRPRPIVVTADRGYGEAAIEDTLTDRGVATVVLPRKDKPNTTRRAVEQSRTFKRHVRWRTGYEGRISCLNRDSGWNRTRIDGIGGARTWSGHGVFNHYLIKIANLTT